MTRAILLIAIGVLGIVLVAGVVIWLVDRTNFPNPWLGMWWALQTVTTIGYGDVVPKTVAGRIFGGVIMITGVAFVSILTATIVSELVARREESLLEDEEREEELTLEEMFRQVDRRLDRIEEAVRK